MRGFNRVMATSPVHVSPFRRGSWAGSAWGTSEIVTAERIGNPLESLDTRVFKRVSKSAIALFGFSECPKITPIWVDFWMFSEKSIRLTNAPKV